VFSWCLPRSELDSIAGPGILESIGSTWALIVLVIAVGIGIMVSVTNSGETKTIEVDRS